MIMHRFFRMFVPTVLFITTTFAAAVPDTGIAIIPRPLRMETGTGSFALTPQSRILVQAGNPELQHIAKELAAGIRQQSGIQLTVSALGKMRPVNAIVLQLQADTLGDEGYRLSIKPGLVTASATKPAGVFYAAQTILQLLPAENKGTASLPAAEIADKPRFGWRGLMLDVGRYYYPVEYIKQYIDYMALHKLNTFHWHLTEDHGWRIEIKKYPRLTAVGAWRDGTQFTHNRVNNNPHGGYYTQEEVKEVVAYAKARYVTVVPEIEMPGHSLAALVAYPELSCTGGPFKMPVEWGIQKDVYCGGNEKTYAFLKDVLTEVATLFPGQTIHIGGDECPKDRWKACSRCQQMIKDKNLKDEHGLQSYFITEIEKFLQTKGKRIIGWDEILEGGLAPNAAVMSWRGTKGGIEAARMLHPVVMSPNQFMYFDYYQGETYLEPYAIGGFLPLRKVYEYEPVPAELNAKEAEYIIGVQGNVWAEFIHSNEKVDYMTYPRAAALAETGWSAADKKDWNDFTRRMESQYLRYQKAGIRYSPSAYNVTFEVKKDSARNKALVTMHTNSFQPEIYYTVNGNEPSVKSLKYQQPFEVNMPVTIRAATFKGTEKRGQVSGTAVIQNGKK